MFKPDQGIKGVVLLMLLGIILIVTILANVILNVILNQGRLTHHQVSRTRAYYAGLAGINLALENLRTGV
jgi:Tfp pilus assembly protein PilX